MKINILYDVKSVNKAILSIKAAKKKIMESIIPEFLKLCCYEIQRIANRNLYALGFSSDMVAEVEAGWQPPIKITNTSYLLRNTGRAYLLEFGTGIIGEQNPHEYANEAGYEYNVDSDYKRDDGSWTFRFRGVDALDVKEEYILRKFLSAKKGTPIILTKGQPAQMFVYDAFSEFFGLGTYKKLWEETKRKHLG